MKLNAYCVVCDKVLKRTTLDKHRTSATHQRKVAADLRKAKPITSQEQEAAERVRRGLTHQEGMAQLVADVDRFVAEENARD